MKIIPKIICLVCIPLFLNMAFMSLMTGDNIIVNTVALGFKPVPDELPYLENGTNLHDNFLYENWCKKTFHNGNYIYEAYKNIAFNIEYTPEPFKTDIWQTPIETEKLKKGDCEDAVILFFSKLDSKQENAEIVWGWIIDRKTGVGRAHVWYQITDRARRVYVVEGFSGEWNGIIPMRIINKTEIRKPILTISHCMAAKLSGILPKFDKWHYYQPLVDLFAEKELITQVSGKMFYAMDLIEKRYFSANEFIEYPVRLQAVSQRYTQNINYTPRHKANPRVNREVYNILGKLHGVFSRYERQNK